MASKDVLQSLKKLISTGEYQDALVICKDSLRENPGIFEYNLCVPCTGQAESQIEPQAAHTSA